MKLHSKDVKILRELDFDARQPVSQIAKKIGLSTEVTAYRIKQLEKKGIITGYYPVIDLSKLGYMWCRFRLDLENINTQMEEKLIELGKKVPSLGWIVFGGSCRVGLIIYAKSMPEAINSYEKIISSFPGVIKAKSFSIAHRIYHFRRNYLYGTDEDEQLVWGENSSVKIDDIDQKILILLTKDARMKYTELASQVGLTSMAVLNRVKRLEKEKLLLGFRCQLDLGKLGYSHHKIYLLTNTLTDNRKTTLQEFLRRSPSVVYLTEAVGPYDFEFEMNARSDREVHDFMKIMREKFPEIKSFENTTFYRMEILRYFPGYL